MGFHFNRRKSRRYRCVCKSNSRRLSVCLPFGRKIETSVADISLLDERFDFHSKFWSLFKHSVISNGRINIQVKVIDFILCVHYAISLLIDWVWIVSFIYIKFILLFSLTILFVFIFMFKIHIFFFKNLKREVIICQ